MSSLTTFNSPARSAGIRSTAGETMRHGAHHGAQKSTKTGTEATISVSKLSASASTTHGSAWWQTLQRGTPVGCERMRLRVPQLGHVTIGVSATARPRIRYQAAYGADDGLRRGDGGAHQQLECHHQHAHPDQQQALEHEMDGERGRRPSPGLRGRDGADRRPAVPPTWGAGLRPPSPAALAAVRYPA